MNAINIKDVLFPNLKNFVAEKSLAKRLLIFSKCLVFLLNILS